MENYLEVFIKHPEISNLNLREITLEDKGLYDEAIKKTQFPVNVWSGNFTYLWAHTNSDQLRIFHGKINGLLVTFILTKKGRLYLPSLPFGKGNADKIIDVLLKCAGICRRWNTMSHYLHKSIVNPINEAQLEFLKQSKRFNQYFYTEDLTGLERHYSIPLLLDLKGKDFGTVRNKLNYFHKNYPNATVRYYEDKDYQDIMKLDALWQKKSGQKYRRIIDGFYFEPIIKHHKVLNHRIILVELNHEIIGITTGEVLPTGEGWGCITKFDHEYRGLSEKLAIEMVKEINHINKNAKTVNVGSDLGSEGLAFFKERFRPVHNYKRYALFFYPSMKEHK